ncbi:MAG: hypothetical protein KAI24_08030 [Planctomycetes bacterium]|nr:hypothetical protein [Planctomycetota bacterium]
MGSSPTPLLHAIHDVVMRSLFPLVACALLLAVPWIGPWVFVVVTFLWWRVVTRVA